MKAPASVEIAVGDRGVDSGVDWSAQPAVFASRVQGRCACDQSECEQVAIERAGKPRLESVWG